MNIYDGVEFVRNLFKPTVITKRPGITATADVAFLSAMCLGAMPIYANNGLYYWYYFLENADNRDVVNFLFNRNGLAPQYHLTHFYPLVTKYWNGSISSNSVNNNAPQYFVDMFAKHPTFRIRMDYLQKYPSMGAFVKSIEAGVTKDACMSPAVLEHLRSQMRANVR